MVSMYGIVKSGEMRVMRKGFNQYFVLTMAGILSLSLLYSLLWARMTATKSERDGSDFMGLYSGARIAQESGFPFIYDVEKQISVQSRVVGFQFPEDQTSYFTHPPFITLLVRLITDQNYAHSLIRWTLILLLLNGLAVFILMKTVSTLDFSKGEKWILAAGTFLFLPTFSGIMNGQDVLVLLLGASLWMLQLLAGNQFRAGLWLGLAAIRPQMALMLSIPFLFRHQKVLVGAAITGSILAALSLGLIGMDGLTRYIHVLGVVESGMWHLPHSKDMPTISGVIRQFFTGVEQNTFRMTVWSVYFIGMGGLSILSRKISVIQERHIGLLVLAGLIFVPYAHYHELTLLLIPLFCLIRIFAEKELVSRKMLAMLPLAVSLFLMIGFIGAGTWKYILVHITMLTMGYFLLFPEKIRSVTR